MDKPEMIYDFIVIGGGPAGYSAAITASKLGVRTLIADSGTSLGGTCLNRGCIPTKALLHSSGLIRQLRSSSMLGVNADYTLNEERLFDYRDVTVSTLVAGLEQSVKASGCDVVRGNAFIMPETADGTLLVDIEGTVYGAKDILLATGTKPSVPPVKGIDSDVVMTSDDLLEGKELPGSIIIVGGGVIGCEIASFFTDLGLNVTVIEALPRILANMDKDVARNLQMILKNRGAEIYSGAQVTGISSVNGKAEVTYTVNGTEQIAVANKVLVATGRQIRLEAAEKIYDKLKVEGGRVVTDHDGRTSVDHIYAAGDIVRGIQLAHKASAEGENIAMVIAGKKPMHDMSVVPACVYCTPEIGCCGMTDVEAKEAGIDAVTVRALTSANSRSVITGEERGFVKLVAEKSTGILIGAQLMCANASDIIGELVTAIANKLSIEDCLKSVRPHPSYEETVGAALEEMMRKI